MTDRRIERMRVTATIREKVTQETRELAVDVPDYDTGYAQLVEQVPDGWQMIAVGVER